MTSLLRTFIFFIIPVISYSCTKFEVKNNTSHKQEQSHNINTDYEKGWIRVKIKQSADYDLSSAVNEIKRAVNASVVTPVFNDGGKYSKRRRKYGLHLWYDIFTGEEDILTRSADNLNGLDCIEIVELIPKERPNSTVGFSLERAPNDPLFNRQWHYFNNGSTPSSILGADVNILPAWKTTTGNPKVIVAVMDGGIDFSHPDLANNMWININEIANNEKDDDNNGYIDDIYGYRWGKEGLGYGGGDIFPMDHGTHCAGIIAAVSNNNTGIAGIAGGNGENGSGVRLISCQTYLPDPAFPNDPYGNSKSTSQTPDAFAYAADNGAVIVNCSFTYGGSTQSAAYKDAIDYFIDNAGVDENGKQTGPMKGGLVVAAAGNDGELVAKYPAAYSRCLSVAYMMSNYIMSPSSNYGPTIDITAPGGATSSSYAPNRAGGVLSTIPMASANYNIERGYSYKSGTSMAVPHVAGIAAIVLSEQDTI